MPLQSSHIQTVLATTFVKRFCSEKLCLYQTLGLHSHGVVSHFMHSWEHSQTAENKVTFPLCQKDLNTFLSGACSSHHVRAAQPALQLASEAPRNARREALLAFLPSPSSALWQEEPVLCSKAWTAVAEVSYCGKAALGLPCHFTLDAQQSTLSSGLQSQSLSFAQNTFPNEWNESKSKGWRKSSFL